MPAALPAMPTWMLRARYAFAFAVLIFAIAACYAMLARHDGDARYYAPSARRVTRLLPADAPDDTPRDAH